MMNERKLCGSVDTLSLDHSVTDWTWGDLMIPGPKYFEDDDFLKTYSYPRDRLIHSIDIDPTVKFEMNTIKFEPVENKEEAVASMRWVEACQWRSARRGRDLVGLNNQDAYQRNRQHSYTHSSFANVQFDPFSTCGQAINQDSMMPVTHPTFAHFVQSWQNNMHESHPYYKQNPDEEELQPGFNNDFSPQSFMNPMPVYGNYGPFPTDPGYLAPGFYQPLSHSSAENQPFTAQTFGHETLNAPFESQQLSTLSNPQYQQGRSLPHDFSVDPQHDYGFDDLDIDTAQSMAQQQSGSLPALILPSNLPQVGLICSSYADVARLTQTRSLAWNWSAPADDGSIPQNKNQRDSYVRQLKTAFEHVATNSSSDPYRSSSSMLASTPPITPGDVTISQQVEYVCWQLVYIAEQLHLHGPRSLMIYDEQKLREVYSSRMQRFNERIDHICTLLQESKPRAQTALKGENLELLVGTAKDLSRKTRRANRQNAGRKELVAAGKKAMNHDEDQDDDEEEEIEDDLE